MQVAERVRFGYDPIMQIEVRRFLAKDIEFGLTQTEREGWDDTAESFEVCLAHDPQGCFIAESDGERVGIVTTTSYRYTAWIGSLIVPPEVRRRGVGARLMKHALAHLENRGVAAIRLEADPPGVALYRKLGFIDEIESLRFRLRHTILSGQGGATALTSSELPAVIAFDTERFGDDRGRLLEILFDRARAAYCVPGGDNIEGYAFVTTSLFGARIGPWVATSPAHAEALLTSILSDIRDSLIFIGIPRVNQAGVELLASRGFRPRPSCLRMVLARQPSTGVSGSIYAIANGAMG